MAIKLPSRPASAAPKAAITLPRTALSPKPAAIKPKINLPTTRRTLPGAAAKTGAAAPQGRVSVSAGFAEAEVVNARQEKRAKKMRALPFRLRLAVGEQAEFVIIDAEPFFGNEHNWKGKDGYWNQFETCRCKLGVCVLCNKLGQEGYYFMAVTVLDKRSYKDKTGKMVKMSRKLCVVKSNMIPTWNRIFTGNGGNLRGLKVKLTRDTDKSPRTGNAVEVISRLTPAQMATFGRDLLAPTNYDLGFEILSEQEMNQLYGGGYTPGQEDFGAGDDSTEGDPTWEKGDVPF